jgi:hypothetical protein
MLILPASPCTTVMTLKTSTPYQMMTLPLPLKILPRILSYFAACALLQVFPLHPQLALYQSSLSIAGLH